MDFIKKLKIKKSRNFFPSFSDKEKFSQKSEDMSLYNFDLIRVAKYVKTVKTRHDKPVF